MYLIVTPMLTPRIVDEAEIFLNPLRQQEIDLHRKGITTVETLECLPETIQYINLRENAISVFELTGTYPNVIGLDLHNNMITSLSPGLANSLPNLEILDLSDNLLEDLDVTSFSKLRVLRISNDRIKNYEMQGKVTLVS